MDEYLVMLRKTGAKLLTLVVDRRLIAYVAVVIGVMFGFPELVNNADALDEQLAEGVQLIIQGVTALLGLLGLIHSWTKRPPSGLDYDKIVYDRTWEIERIMSSIQSRQAKDE